MGKPGILGSPVVALTRSAELFEKNVTHPAERNPRSLWRPDDDDDGRLGVERHGELPTHCESEPGLLLVWPNHEGKLLDPWRHSGAYGLSDKDDVKRMDSFHSTNDQVRPPQSPLVLVAAVAVAAVTVTVAEMQHWSIVIGWSDGRGMQQHFPCWPPLCAGVAWGIGSKVCLFAWLLCFVSFGFV